MAQPEDTELRDLVIEALEKNGSLAKIRALLRANIFLSFEDERQSIIQNASLDNIFKMPDGVLALSIVHEFLEFCNLKNTLFVYVSESRQGKEYNYEGKKSIIDKINVMKQDLKEPILITLMKTLSKYQNSNSDSAKCTKERHSDNNCKDEQNCTYIVHEDSQSSNSNTSNSNSDHSSDEKNKLHLRLQLDNSDTDTSSDSARDKTSSEYIPNEYLPLKNVDKDISHYSIDKKDMTNIQKLNQVQSTPQSIPELKIITSSSDSTSYVDIKSFNASNTLLNAPEISKKCDKKHEKSISQSAQLQKTNKNEVETDKSVTLSSGSSLSLQNVDEEKIKSSVSKSNDGSAKSDAEIAEYSYDFSSSPGKLKDIPEQYTRSSEYEHEEKVCPSKIISVQESQNHSPQSSRSSVSISDVADLISHKSSSSHQTRNEKSVNYNKSDSSNKISNYNQSKIPSDNSGEFTESTVPSLSNLSLDIHSD